MHLPAEYSLGPWTDIRYLAGWRLQAHADGRRGRLLTPDHRVLLRDELPECRQRLEKIAAEQHLSWARNRFLLTVHGLGRTGRSMTRLLRRLSASLEAEPVNFFYATTWKTVDQHAAALDHILAELPEGAHLDVVAHSLGAIVTRRWFGMLSGGQSRCAEHRFAMGRMVMLGPPNQGSRVAYRLRNRWLFQKVMGPSGQDLGRGWDQLRHRLAIPPMPFGVIAGRVGNGLFRNPLLVGPSDLIVSEEETRLEGAADTLVLPVPHALLMMSRKAIEASERFLQTGQFSGQAEGAGGPPDRAACGQAMRG